MAISFLSVPTGIRTPGVFTEVDNSRAQQGSSIQPYKALLLGQRLSAGTKPALELVQISSEAQAKEFFGQGSHLASMCEAFLANDRSTELFCVALDDDGAAVAAVKEVDLDGTATEDGTFSIMIGGKRYRVAVASGDTATDIVAAIVAEINDDADRFMQAAINGGDATILDLTARNAGLVGSEIDVRLNYFDDEELPAGITLTSITETTAGAANPDLSSVWALLGETQYNIIAHPFNDSASLTEISTEMEDRFLTPRENPGQAISAKADTLSNLNTYGQALNEKHLHTMSVTGPSPTWFWAAAVAAQASISGKNDPARPMQTLVLSGVLPGRDDEQFTIAERDSLLNNGIATHTVDSGGNVRIERLITHFRENAFGQPDTSYLDIQTLLTLDYIRFDFRTRFSSKYARFKLASDGVRIAPGQPIITPNIARAEAISFFRDWEVLGLVEGAEQYKRDLIVERNAQDPNRLDFLLPPDLVNQLRVAGVQIQFLL